MFLFVYQVFLISQIFLVALEVHQFGGFVHFFDSTSHFSAEVGFSDRSTIFAPVFDIYRTNLGQETTWWPLDSPEVEPVLVCTYTVDGSGQYVPPVPTRQCFGGTEALFVAIFHSERSCEGSEWGLVTRNNVFAGHCSVAGRPITVDF